MHALLPQPSPGFFPSFDHICTLSRLLAFRSSSFPPILPLFACTFFRFNFSNAFQMWRDRALILSVWRTAACGVRVRGAYACLHVRNPTFNPTETPRERTISCEVF